MAELNTLGADMETGMQARTAAQRSAHLAAMGSSFTDAQKIAVQDALLDSWLYGVLTADYPLTSTTALQQLFNWSAGGAIALATGFWMFETTIYITGMSGTSGNAQFDLKGAGGATITVPTMHAIGADANTPSSQTAQSGAIAITTATGAAIVTAGTGTGLGVTIRGTLNVTVAGTIVPSIALLTAAAAVVTAGSNFRCRRLGATGSNTRGTWT